MEFQCSICDGKSVAKTATRGDGKQVLFCRTCGMGVVADPPANTDYFYADGYYGGGSGETLAYDDYASTSAHTLLWVKLFLSELCPADGRILDVGCADGHLLDSLTVSARRYGVENNPAAAEIAKRKGIHIISHDILRVTSDQVELLDIISSIATFEHILDMRKGVEICLDLLKPGGILVLEVPLISEHADNSDWFNGSYEHIYYPTVTGVSHLMASFSGLYWRGVECNIIGHGSSYICIASRDLVTFRRAEVLLQAMRQDSLVDLTGISRQLNVAYHLVHRFDVTPERILALLELFDANLSRLLFKRLLDLWYVDSVRSKHADYFEAQAKNWQEAWRKADEAWRHVQGELNRRVATVGSGSAEPEAT